MTEVELGVAAPSEALVDADEFVVAWELAEEHGCNMNRGGLVMFYM